MVGVKQYSKKELAEGLRSLYENWGNTSINTINKCADLPHSNTFADYFDSMSEAREQADVSIRKFDIGKERLLDYLREMEREKFFDFARSVETYNVFW